MSINITNEINFSKKLEVTKEGNLVYQSNFKRILSSCWLGKIILSKICPGTTLDAVTDKILQMTESILNDPKKSSHLILLKNIRKLKVKGMNKGRSSILKCIKLINQLIPLVHIELISKQYKENRAMLFTTKNSASISDSEAENWTTSKEYLKICENYSNLPAISREQRHLVNVLYFHKVNQNFQSVYNKQSPSAQEIQKLQSQYTFIKNEIVDFYSNQSKEKQDQEISVKGLENYIILENSIRLFLDKYPKISNEQIDTPSKSEKRPSEKFVPHEKLPNHIETMINTKIKI